MSFLVGFAFVRWASKEAFGIYTLVYAAMLLFQSVQNAIVISPMMTIVPGREDAQRASLILQISRIQYALSMLLLLLWIAAGLLAVQFVPPEYGFSIGLLLAGAVALAGLLLREFGRGQAFLEGKPASALAQDVAFGTLTLLGLLMLVIQDTVTAHGVLLASGTAALLVAAIAQVLRTRGYRIRAATADSGRDQRSAVRAELWTCAKWALPSVIASWAYSNAYVYIVAFFATAHLVADLSASRLVLAPLPLMLTAWMNVFRPRASAWYRTGELSALLRAARYSAIALVLGGLAFGAAVYAAYPWIEALFLGTRYAGLEALIIGWSLYFVAGAVRGVGMTCVLSSPAGFRLMHHYTWIAMAIALGAVVAASMVQSAAGVLFAMAMAECMFAGLVWMLGWRAVRRMREHSQSAGGLDDRG